MRLLTIAPIKDLIELKLIKNNAKLSGILYFSQKQLSENTIRALYNN